MEQTQQIQKRDEKAWSWAGTFHKPKSIQWRLDRAVEEFHIVAPATTCGVLPEGFGVAIGLVHIDPEVDCHDVGGGKVGLLKHTLDRIANGLGVSWDPKLSARLDDGSDPRYCSYRIVGRYRGFDGQWREVFDECELDLRDGSDQAEAIMKKARSKDVGETQLRDMRKWILRHTLTRARLRAIRATGVRTAYTPKELAKPFLVFGMQLTGHSDDPELRREFARMQFSAAVGASNALYGAAPQSAALPPPERAALSARASGVVLDMPPDEDEDDGALEMEPTPAPRAQAAPAPAQRQRRNTPVPSAPQGDGTKPRETFQFGRGKGGVIAEATDDDIEGYATFLEKGIDDPEKARFRAQNIADAAYCRRLLAQRAGEDEHL